MKRSELAAARHGSVRPISLRERLLRKDHGDGIDRRVHARKPVQYGFDHLAARHLTQPNCTCQIEGVPPP